MRGTASTFALFLIVLGAGQARGETTLNRISDVRLQVEGDRSTLTIVGSAQPEYTITSRSLPSRLVVDLTNARAEGVGSRINGGTDQITEVSLGARYVRGALSTRVFVYLRGTVAYQVEVENNSLVLSFVSVEADPEPPPRPATRSPRTEEARSPEPPPPTEAPATAAPPRPRVQAPPSQPTHAESAASAAAGQRVHVVRPGEVIARIAARYNVSVQDILGWNPGVRPDSIRVGQELVVQNPGPARHRVRFGEVLSAIAERYGVTIEDLVRWNPGLDPDHIRVGSTLVVHGQ